MNFEYHKAIIRDIINENASVKRYFIEFSGMTVFPFVAGQFVIIHFPEINHHFKYRSYSIASAPDNTNIIEIVVVLKEDGAATPELFTRSIGDIIEVTEAMGKFVLPAEPVTTDLCFICTGTGIAPFRSIIKDIYNHYIPHQNIYLIFGARTQQDLLYRLEFETLADMAPEFNYIPVLSRESWTGPTGYVHAVYETLFADKRDALFYLCGWSNMVKEARERLRVMDYSRKQVKLELYD